MSITLGEKLRQAREERGISISGIADQTRISPLYIKAIEEDNYTTLPGGIFNKGFVKSYAKCVGVDEQEALQDYAALLNSQTGSSDDEPKSYRPQVLTDDRASSSGFKTLIFAAVIVGLIVAGIFALMSFLNGGGSNETVVNNKNAANTNVAAISAPVAANTPNAAAAPSMNDLKVSLSAVGAPVSVSSVSDGKKASALLSPDKPIEFTPKENLKFSYAKSLASNVQMTVNGKSIALPLAPANLKRNAIDIEITKENLAQIWQNGKISFDAAPAP